MWLLLLAIAVNWPTLQFSLQVPAPYEQQMSASALGVDKYVKSLWTLWAMVSSTIVNLDGVTSEELIAEQIDFTL